MQFVFLLPGDIDGVPTGGNVYNREIMAALEGHALVRAVRWPADPGPEAVARLDLGERTVVVVDSLLAAQIPALREVHPDGCFVLLAHYLACVDPREAGSAQVGRERSWLPLFDGFAVPSRYVKEVLLEEGIPAARITVAEPGLDDAYRAPVPPRAPTDTPRLLTVSNLHAGKGFMDVLPVLDSLADLAWQWTIVGGDALDPDFATRFTTRLGASPVADRVDWQGPVPGDTLRALYDGADIFLHPSRFETCSMVTREAMARALPIAAFRVGGLPDNLPPAYRPVLASPGDRDALARRLRLLCTDATHRRTEGTAMRTAAMGFVSWSDAAHVFRDLAGTICR